jgi:HSP20 family molecular chaperone IbpA
MYKHEQAVRLKAKLPGALPDDVQVKIKGNMLKYSSSRLSVQYQVVHGDFLYWVIE